MMQASTPVDFTLLDALARFRLLTVMQAERLGIARRWHLGDRLRVLETARLVGVIRRGKMLGPNVYTLTPKGAATLEGWAAETGESRTVGVRKSPFRLGPHLTQRLCIVDVHIALRAWAAETGARVDWVRTEFDPNPNGLEPATAVTFNGVRYVADALASVTLPDGEPWLFALEVETGGGFYSLENFRAHLAERLAVFQAEALEDALGWPVSSRAARLLFVFQTAEMLERAQKMVGRPHEEVWRKVFFNSLPTVVEGFASGWGQVGGTTGSPFRPIGAP